MPHSSARRRSSMLCRIGARLTYSNIVATLALMLALAGGAYAAVSGIPNAAGIYHGCVNSQSRSLRVVKDPRSCRRARLIHRGNKRIVIPGEFAIAWSRTGPRGTQGRQGPPGLNGVNGTNGTNSATNVVVRSLSIALNPGAFANPPVSCNAGEHATGGGAVTSPEYSSGIVLNASFPTVDKAFPTAGQTPNGWTMGITNNTGITLTANVYAVCASP